MTASRSEMGLSSCGCMSVLATVCIVVGMGKPSYSCCVAAIKAVKWQTSSVQRNCGRNGNGGKYEQT